MSNSPYHSDVLDCFANPAHAGEVAGGAVAFFEDQGLRIRLSANVAENTLTELRFLAWGCPHVIAAAETFCRQFEGRPAVELELFKTDQIMQDLAVPVEKTGRILVLEDTVRSLRAAIQDRLVTTQD
jgi:NifU-like protein involved in Fe-S cluster formation